MSTLVIIAHVKDGAELAREHHLPKRIIDLIEQHHGTTLVEYFFQRATRQSEEAGEEPRDALPVEQAHLGGLAPRVVVTVGAHLVGKLTAGGRGGAEAHDEQGSQDHSAR